MLSYKPPHSGGSHYREGLLDSRYKIERGIESSAISVGMWSSSVVLYLNKVPIITT